MFLFGFLSGVRIVIPSVSLSLSSCLPYGSSHLPPFITLLHVLGPMLYFVIFVILFILAAAILPMAHIVLSLVSSPPFQEAGLQQTSPEHIVRAPTI